MLFYYSLERPSIMVLMTWQSIHEIVGMHLHYLQIMRIILASLAMVFIWLAAMIILGHILEVEDLTRLHKLDKRSKRSETE